MTVVVKIGTSSVTTSDGGVDHAALAKLTDEVALAVAQRHRVVVVTSGAITAGAQRLGLPRPAEPELCQALAAIGQIDLMAAYRALFERHGLLVGQVLLTPHDFRDRSQYLHARATIERLLRLGVVPIANENDTIADDAIRYGDNDRIAALVANLLRADLLLLLTDTAGLHTADPRFDPDATLISEIRAFSPELEAAAGAAGAEGSGGMASKLAAAKMASWSGVRTVIAAAARPGIVADAVAARVGIGTTVAARDAHVAARKLWIGFAVAPRGRITVDDGAVAALTVGGRSLLCAGVTQVEGDFEAHDAVEIADAAGRTFAKGLAAARARDLRPIAGRSTRDLADGIAALAVHRDDLLVLDERS